MGKLTISMAIFQFAFCMFTRPGIQMIPEKINVFVVSTSRHFGNTLKNMNTKFKTNNPEYPHVNPFGNMLFSSRNYVNHLSLIEGLLTVFSLCQTFQTPYMNTFWTCFFWIFGNPQTVPPWCDCPHNPLSCLRSTYLESIENRVYHTPSKQKLLPKMIIKPLKFGGLAPKCSGTKPTNQPFSSQMTS